MDMFAAFGHCLESDLFRISDFLLRIFLQRSLRNGLGAYTLMRENLLLAKHI